MNATMRTILSVGTSGILMMVTWLLYAFGWRTTFPILGVGTLLIGIPLTWFFVKPKRPEYYGWLPDGKRVGEEVAAGTEATIQRGVEYAAEQQEVEFTLRQALKDKAWYLCFLVFGLRQFVFSAIQAHNIPILTDRGIDPMAAAVASGIMVFMMAPGRLTFGWLADRLSIRRLRYLVILALSIEALGIFFLIRATNMAWIWAFLVIYGVGQGASSAMQPPLRGRYWGRKAYASIQGIMHPIVNVFSVIGAPYAGWVYDTTGSYVFALQVFLICLLVSMVIAYFLTPPKPPKKIGKITQFV